MALTGKCNYKTGIHKQQCNVGDDELDTDFWGLGWPFKLFMQKAIRRLIEARSLQLPTHPGGELCHSCCTVRREGNRP